MRPVDVDQLRRSNTLCTITNPTFHMPRAALQRVLHPPGLLTLTSWAAARMGTSRWGADRGPTRMEGEIWGEGVYEGKETGRERHGAGSASYSVAPQKGWYRAPRAGAQAEASSDCAVLPLLTYTASGICTSLRPELAVYVLNPVPIFLDASMLHPAPTFLASASSTRSTNQGAGRRAKGRQNSWPVTTPSTASGTLKRPCTGAGVGPHRTHTALIHAQKCIVSSGTLKRPWRVVGRRGSAYVP